jgi:hypothetical protein
MAKKKAPKPPGPEPERLKIDGDWEDAAKKALEKKRPADGWPKPTKKKGRG